MQELKQCPFCDGEIKKVNRLGIPMFKCQKLKCGAVVSFDNYFANHREAEAIKNWNTRAEGTNDAN